MTAPREQKGPVEAATPNQARGTFSPHQLTKPSNQNQGAGLADLGAEGIQLRNWDLGEHKTICPRCSHKRKKKTDPCLSVRLDPDDSALWNCWHCGWKGAISADPNRKGRSDFIKPKPKPRPPEPAPTKPADRTLLDWMEKRGISQEIVERQRIYSLGRGESWRIVFPYLKGGLQVNRKYRTHDKKFTQDPGAERTFYNIDAVGDAETAVIVEGEMDVLSLLEAGINEAITLPDGAPAKANMSGDRRYEPLNTCNEELKNVKRYILAGDADDPGGFLIDELARRIGRDRCWLVKWPEGCKDANDTLVKHGPKAVQKYIAQALPCPTDEPTIRRKALTFYDWNDRTAFPKREQLVEDLLDRGGLSVWYGQPGSLKSFLMIHLGGCLSKGWPFFGHQTRACRVGYLVLEGEGAFPDRISAFLQHHDLPVDEPIMKLMGPPINFVANGDDVEKIIAGARKLSLDVIIIDTLSKVLAGGDENSSTGMGALVEAIDRLRCEAGCHVAVVHHSGKNEENGPRGHSSMIGNSDLIMRISRNKNAEIATFEASKNKDGREHAHSFVTHSYKVGKNSFGRDQYSLAIEPCETQRQGPKLSPQQKHLLKIARQCLDEAGEKGPSHPRIPDGAKVAKKDTLKAWADNAGLSGSENPDSVKRAFNDAFKRLQDFEILGYWKPYFWDKAPDK